MKRIGIIGGMSYESTLHYYERINRQVNERAGGLTSADLVLRSVNFAEYNQLMESGNWEQIGRNLSMEALFLTMNYRCDYLAIATNTMHKVAGVIAEPHTVISKSVCPDIPVSVGKVRVPLVHIGDCIADECAEIGAKTVLLLGTKFTMTEDFMIRYLEERGLQLVNDLVDSSEVNRINNIIFGELCRGAVSLDSREFLVDFVHDVSIECMEQGIAPYLDAVILGCTELEMILEPSDFGFPVINSTQTHIDKLVELCLEE